MGLFDSLGGMLGNALGQQGGGALEGLIGQAGGLDGIVNQLNQAGLGEQVSSWLGSGANMPVDAATLSNALGGDNIMKLAGSLGLDASQVAEQLATLLPGLIDKASPDGSLDLSVLGNLFGK